MVSVDLHVLPTENRAWHVALVMGERAGWTLRDRGRRLTVLMKAQKLEERLSP